jgi:hypothetical protein
MSSVAANQYIGTVSQYKTENPFSIQLSGSGSVYVPAAQQETAESLFSVFGVDQQAKIHSLFAGINKPDNTPFLPRTFDAYLEVINLIIAKGNVSDAYSEMVELSSVPGATIPWDLSLMKPYDDDREDAIKMEFQDNVGIDRPDGSVCSYCKNSKIYPKGDKVMRSIDEGTILEAECVECGMPY